MNTILSPTGSENKHYWINSNFKSPNDLVDLKFIKNSNTPFTFSHEYWSCLQSARSSLEKLNIENIKHDNWMTTIVTCQLLYVPLQFQLKDETIFTFRPIRGDLKLCYGLFRVYSFKWTVDKNKTQKFQNCNQNERFSTHPSIFGRDWSHTKS